ncbi:MAG: hypothetical protein AAF902_05905 [Chloroflexota bacterium]
MVTKELDQTDKQMADENIIYKVSYVVEGGNHPGAIINEDHLPKPGDQVSFDGNTFVVTEVQELMPPLGDFGFLHASCKPI